MAMWLAAQNKAVVFATGGGNGANGNPTTHGRVAMTTMHSLWVWCFWRLWWQLHCHWQNSSLFLPSLHSAGEEKYTPH